MSGLQHSLEPNGRSIRFNNSANGAASQQNGSTYIRAGAPNIPPQVIQLIYVWPCTFSWFSEYVMPNTFEKFVYMYVIEYLLRFRNTFL